MKKIIYIISVFLCSCLYSQTGINTTTPDSKLHIKGTNNGIPSLQINTHENANGSNNGDLSIIDNMLFKYDAVRQKWLSIETSIYNFAEDENSATRLEYTGDIEITGPIIPMDATIVYYSVNAIGGTANKDLRIIINDVDVPDNNVNPNKDGLITLQGLKYQNSNFDLDVKAGDIIRFEQPNGVGAFKDVTVEIILKWRK